MAQPYVFVTGNGDVIIFQVWMASCQIASKDLLSITEAFVLSLNPVMFKNNKALEDFFFFLLF